MEISIVMPAHNEAAAIRKTVTDFLRAFPKAEIIAVDDGSSDGTRAILNSIGSRRLRVLQLPKRSGKGAAVMKGVGLATKNLVAFVDADGAFGPSSLKKLVRDLDGYDCVIASKWKGKKFSEVGGSAPKKAFGRIWNAVARGLLGLEFEDTQAGLKLFRSAAIRRIGTDLFCRGFEFDAEILYRLTKNGFRIKEIFVEPKDVKKSRFSYLNMPAMLSSIFFMAVALKLFSKPGKR
ncbi:MAG: glycosyltransferase [Candidatus Aenigmarchaeota archaeon]|nr:glycosyltransferase [Candidatus Aenigmarchaeota archaeon]